MTVISVLYFCGAVLCLGLVCLVLFRDHRSFEHRVFAVGMTVLALEALFCGLSVTGVFPEDVGRWQRWRWGAAALVPGCWLLFCLRFPQRDPKAPVRRKWTWLVLVAFLIPLSFVTVFAPAFFKDRPVYDPVWGWFVGFGWSGYAFVVFLMISVVAIMMVLEQALRASKGLQRWGVKFLVLGLGTLFAARVYTGSQVLLFHGLKLDLEIYNAMALIVADVLILISIYRARLLKLDIYLSQTMLYRSLTLLVVGIYLLGVAFLSKAAVYFEEGFPLNLSALSVFLALVILAICLLSDRLRLRVKRFVSRNFRRPQYDYRKAWRSFTERTTRLVETRSFSNAIVKMYSEMFDILAVSLWIPHDWRKSPEICGTTALSGAEAKESPFFQEGSAELLQLMQVDLEGQREDAGVIPYSAAGGTGAACIRGHTVGGHRERP